MNHVSYGIFSDADHARAAIDGIEASGTPRRRCGVVLHKDRLDEGSTSVSETDAAAGARDGAALGAILGAAAGAIAGALLGLLSGGALGAFYGVFGGALAGAATPDRSLEKLSKELATGKVLVVVEAPSLACRERADAVMRAQGGHVEHKPFF